MPTTNPVPSTDPSDLLFNAGKLDEVVNGAANSFTDRLGSTRRTVAGMNADFDAQLADAESDLNIYRADAAASAAEALGYLQTIRATSYGAYASDPATDPLGNPPTVGDEYFNTTANLLKRWNGTTWQASDINTANLAAPSGASLVGYIPSGTGAVATTVQTALRLLPFANLYTSLQASIDAAITNNLPTLRLPPGDFTLPSTSPLTITSSIILEGSVSASGEMMTRLLCPGSGILVERAAGTDNIVGVHLKNLRIDKTGTAKDVGSFGIKAVGANASTSFENVDIRYFEKNWWLKGVIGAQFRNVSGAYGKYGAYTETHSPLAYDTTNCDFYGCKFFNQNDVGVYLGPITQGLNFFGGDIERNTVGVQFANTAPASGAINFYGTWFEANGTHWTFTQKPTPVTFGGCYVYGGASGGTTLWSNGGSGTITATVRGCKLSATMSVDMDVFNGVWEHNKDDGTLTYSATEPNGYYFQRLAGTSFAIGTKTIYNVENIGAGRYDVWAAGTPATAGFVIGSRWTDVTTGLDYLHDGTAFKKNMRVLEASVTNDFAPIAAQSTANTLVTVAGVVAGDAVAIGVDGTPPNGLIFNAVATAANAVRVYAHNFTGASIDPASFTFNIKVFK